MPLGQCTSLQEPFRAFVLPRTTSSDFQMAPLGHLESPHWVFSEALAVQQHKNGPPLPSEPGSAPPWGLCPALWPLYWLREEQLLKSCRVCRGVCPLAAPSAAPGCPVRPCHLRSSAHRSRNGPPGKGCHGKQRGSSLEEHTWEGLIWPLTSGSTNEPATSPQQPSRSICFPAGEACRMATSKTMSF